MPAQAHNSIAVAFCTLVVCLAGCQSVAPPATNDLGPDDLPADGSLLSITSNVTLRVPAGQVGQFGGTIMIESNGVLNLIVDGEVAVGDDAFIVGNTGDLIWTHRGSLTGGTLTLDNRSGNLVFNGTEGAVDLEALSTHNRGWGTIDWNSHGMAVGALDARTYAAETSFSDSGEMRFDVIDLLDQNDDTRFTCAGIAEGGQFNVVANGEAGNLDIVFSGVGTIEGLHIDVNYGGTANIDVATGADLDLGTLELDCSGTSHGKASSGTLHIDGVLHAETTSYSAADNHTITDVTEAGGAPTWLITYSADETLTIVNNGTTNLPAPA